MKHYTMQHINQASKKLIKTIKIKPIKNGFTKRNLD